jgi:RNA polymerase sigma factor (sigma-70 family)
MMTNKADTELVALARAGNKDAFGQLIERYAQMVRQVVLSMVTHEEIARELAQEAILQAYLSLDQLRDNSRFKSWLYGIALNVCRSYIRDQKADLFSIEALTGGMHHDIAYFPATVLDPEEIAEQRELHRIVLKAVQGLSPKERVATLLFYYEQLSLREIAAILGVSVPAIKGRLYRAREQLKERLLPVIADAKGESGREEQGERRKTMVQVKVAAVWESTETKQYVVILLDEAGQRIVNIWIGAHEALVIGMGQAEIPAARPMGIHLMMNLLQATGIEFEEARVERLTDDVFYAVARFRSGNTVHELDARPSDAIALAVLMNKPIYVAEEVIEQCSIALPAGKRVQVDKDKAREYYMRKIEAQKQSSLASAEQFRCRSAGERKQQERELIEFLTGE